MSYDTRDWFTSFSDLIGVWRRHPSDCAVLGIAVDNGHAHLAWRRMPRSESGIGEISFPLISDLDKSIARAYGVLLDQPAVALRGVFIIDRQGIVRSMQVNDLPLGCNVDEILSATPSRSRRS